MLISAVVPTYDRYPLLDNCLGGLASQTLPRDRYEIIVVDNTPDRARSDRHAASHAGVTNLRWIHEPRAGAAHARNVGMWQARAPLIAFTEDDAVPSPGWLAALLEAFAVLGEAVHVVGGPVRAAWGGGPRPDWLGDGLLAYLGVIDRGPEVRVLGEGEWVTGASLAYRTERLRAAGGFLPSLGRVGSGAVLLSNEETDLEERIRAAGGQVGWAPGAVVEHVIDLARRDRRWFRRRAAWQAVSDFIRHPDYFARHFGANWAEAEGYLAFQRATAALTALAEDQADPAMCHWQVSAIYHLTLCLLGGADRPPA
ncbi:MAG: glycosyltransferase family 2 protein [Alphaproteobacteria bacterium]|nr:glycosyltransferase family 2 protein [Alphaproteobacteria bacterium]